MTAHVRTHDAAARVATDGIRPAVGDLLDAAWLRAQLDGVDGAIHTASPGDATSAANLYGHGGGLVALLLNGPVADGALGYPGDHQPFANVVVDDAAAAYVAALDRPPAGPALLDDLEHGSYATEGDR